ncbi:uncharacterized protein LOC108603286 isoform X1 [Drosophila busckii]|uniref:uncharacterized protein LOC108603286 isoform X1 n=1 Tax=Drosophila busckii TaxID=30019 RepID=UPI00083EBC39|nr:uncharacterized protein LOC108603286 isoform X1 [Drosophila busckii]XP_017847444.1 uncharacterized protein LOC108603286 isoform X1 [Drosophila busckii]
MCKLNQSKCLRRRLLPLAFVVCLLALPNVRAANSSSNNNKSEIIADAELSASERNRRLIPYMAFYLPAPELPINQQYAVKHISAAGAAHLAPPAIPARIPVPVAYMTQPHRHNEQQQQQQRYQAGAADVYHALAQHQAGPAGPPVYAKEPTAEAGGAAFIAYKPLNPTHKHKTVQHFPPLSQQEQQQQHQQQQQLELLPPPLQFYRQHGKQSKINLTPFTAQNTLPGHFVPIIYGPVSKPSSNNELLNGNTINYNRNNNNNHKLQQQQQPATDIYHKNAHQTQIVTDYAEEQERQENALHAPAPSAVAGYKVYKESDPATGTAITTSSSSTTTLGNIKNALVLRGGQKAAAGHVSKYESYFNMSPDQEQLTPQEKYVHYLQQRMKQQQQQQQNELQAHVKAVGKHQYSHAHHKPPAAPAPLQHNQSPHNYNRLFVRPTASHNAQQQQQVLHIPLRSIMANLHEQEPLLGSPAPPPAIIDYLIDAPRQSLDEEPAHHHHHPQPTPAPQHAFILVTSAAPYTPARLPELTPTRAPLLYKHQPTLRLQPVAPPTPKYKATRRPIYVAPPTPSQQTVQITPKYSYKPTVLEAPSVKLKPVHKYAARPNQLDSDLPDIHSSSLAEILHKLQASNHLPQTLTPDNIDNSIKTLIRILNNLKQTQSQTLSKLPDLPQQQQYEHESSKQQYASSKPSSADYEEQAVDTTTLPALVDSSDAAVYKLNAPNKHPGPSTGRAGIDYPNYADIPKTSFECTSQRYKGFFGDPETDCQVWHYCDLNGGKASFLCPNGTIFSQIALTCDWWFNVKCSTTSQLYVLNERLYKYILPFNPKFPQDYNGPIVDKYLAMKFQEMEEKMRVDKQRKANEQQAKATQTQEASTPALPKNHKPEPKSGSGINAQVYEQSSERNLLIDDEIDDISERGTFDTFEQTPTTIMAPTATATALDKQPLGLKPIIVSSTPEPELQQAVQETNSNNEQDEAEVEDKLQILRDTSAAVVQKLAESGVSVEKQEVIEIKTDGSTGHLLPPVVDSAEEEQEQSSEQQSSAASAEE